MLVRYSMLQAYLECPKAFYDRYVLNKLETEQSAALEFGSAMHLGIKTMLEGSDGVASFNMYWNSVKDVHMQYYDMSWTALKELAEHFLGNFKSRHLKKFTEFEQEVQMEMPFLSGNTLQGTADFIGMYEGVSTIVDWKTSSRDYPKNKIELNPQLYIYAKLYQHKTGKLPEQIMYKVFNKKTGNINTIKKQLTPEYLERIFSSVENTARAMLRTIETKELFHGPNCYCETLGDINGSK